MRLFSLLVTALPLVAVVVVVLLVIRTSRKMPAKGRARYDVANGSGVWYAQVRAPGIRLTTLRNMLNDWGLLQVDGGQVTFTPDGAQTPAWSVPATRMRVQWPSGIGTTFNAEVPQVGKVTIEPSTSRRARWRSAGSWPGSDLRTTQDVVTILHGWGARA
ncbi:hypothetical protein [Flexivirga oryzae]|uniref:DUF2550 family protein n=1 Tax=Flexivirga oryzae TaxID=1794944 RepID=A0A839MZ44_9MICO|nr:hypothetical protein [Flexivirga oryzae]MBB2890678.1 hypothetical protein [Flexivirga oryzae]